MRLRPQRGLRVLVPLLAALTFAAPGVAAHTQADDDCLPSSAQQAYEQLLAAAPDGGDVEAQAHRIAVDARAGGTFDDEHAMYALDDLAFDNGYLFDCTGGVYRFDPEATSLYVDEDCEEPDEVGSTGECADVPDPAADDEPDETGHGSHGATEPAENPRPASTQAGATTAPPAPATAAARATPTAPTEAPVTPGSGSVPSAEAASGLSEPQPVGGPGDVPTLQEMAAVAQPGVGGSEASGGAGNGTNPVIMLVMGSIGALIMLRLTRTRPRNG